MNKAAKVNKIIISRTDSIGDVILTLPMAGVLKELMPGIEIVFLGRSYTKEVVNNSRHIDEFVDWSEVRKHSQQEQILIFKSLKADAIIHVFPVKEISRLSMKAGIRHRYGTTGRFYHWFTCNHLIKLSRRNSPLHEAQLNLKLLKQFGAKDRYSLDEIPSYYGFEAPGTNKDISKYLRRDKYNLILHPKSKGSAREWGLVNFKRLAGILPVESFNILISGTAEEGEMIGDAFAEFSHVQKVTGKFSLKEYMQLIAAADGLIAASTGPLHIAAALGKTAIGIYPPIRPMHPGRWAPLGRNAHFLVIDKVCNKCRSDYNCECIRNIAPEMVKQKLMEVAS